MSAPGGAPSRAYAHYVLGVLVVVYVFNFVDRQILAILLEPIKRDLGVSDTAMGFLTGPAFALFYAFAGVPIARLADASVRRSVIAAGVAVWSLMTAVSGLARSYAFLAAARIGVGVGEAAASPSAHSLISDYFPPARRATALSIYNMGANVGIMLGLWLGGWLGQSVGWRAAFMIVGLPGLAVALLVRVTVREPARGLSEGRAAPDALPPLREVAGHMLAQRSFRHICMVASLFSFANYGLSVWGPTFLIRLHGMGLGEAGFWMGLVQGVGGAAGTFLGGWLSDRLGRRDPRWRIWVPGLGGAVAVPLMAFFLLWPDVAPGLVAYAVAIVGLLFFVGTCYSLTQSLAPLRMRAQASALILLSISLIGLGVGPLAVGVLNDLLAARLGEAAIRWSLLATALLGGWGIVHALLAARSLPADLEAAAAA